jgi:hypothetical protein
MTQNASRIFHVGAKAAWQAMAAVPKLGSEPDDMKGFICVAHDVEMLPQTLLARLLLRQKQWKVTALFVPK